MRKILITGANGYIGQHVSNTIKKIVKNHELIRTDIRPSQGNDNNFIDCDILNEASNINLYEKLGKPDVLIHLAWQDGFNHKSLSHIANLYNHYLFIKNMIESGCSSISIMGSMHEVGYYEGAVDENTPCNPLSLYGIAKNSLREMSLLLAKDTNCSMKWLRGFYIYGDDIKNHSIFTKIKQMANDGQKTFPFTDGLNKYDFISVDNIAEQIVKASIQNEIDGIINVCSGKPVTLKEQVEKFINENNLDIKPEYGVFPTRPYDSPAIWGNNTKINEILHKYENIK